MQNNKTKLALLLGIIATMSLGTMNTVAADTSERTGVAIGHVTLVLRDSDGEIKQYVQTDNVVTHEGLDCLVDTLFGSGPTGTCTTTGNMNIIGLGIGAAGGATAVGLTTPLASGCIAFADPGVVADAGTSTQAIQVEVIFGGLTSSGADLAASECEATITEAGLFNTGGAAVATNNMFSIQGFTGVAVAAADTLTVTWDIDFT